MALKIRRDDTVVVTSGKDRGKTGKVLRVDPKKERVYVEGMNIVKRHQRPMQSTDPVKAAGGVVEKEGADPHLQRHAGRPEGQQAHPRRHQPRERAPRPGHQALRLEARLIPWPD